MCMEFGKGFITLVIPLDRCLSFLFPALSYTFQIFHVGCMSKGSNLKPRSNLDERGWMEKITAQVRVKTHGTDRLASTKAN